MNTKCPLQRKAPADNQNRIKSIDARRSINMRDDQSAIALNFQMLLHLARGDNQETEMISFYGTACLKIGKKIYLKTSEYG